MMRRTTAAAALFIALGAASTGSVGCGTAQSSATKTNWFRSCETSSDCDGSGSCICGTCTTACEVNDDCEAGICGSAIGAASECQSSGRVVERERRLCQDEEASCSEFFLAHDPDLGDAIEPSCDAPQALVCESFDDVLPDEYSTWTDGTIASLTDCNVHAGTGALRYFSGDQTTQTRIRLPSAVSEGELHVRFFVNLSSSTVVSSQLLLLELWDDSEPDHPGRLTVHYDATGHLGVYAGAEGAEFTAMGTTLPLDEWICIELSARLSETEGAVTLLADGVPLLEETGIDTLPTSGFDVVVVESLPFEETPETLIDFSVDELVVALGPIGCD